jgi:parallel beta-helix repeat protein
MMDTRKIAGIAVSLMVLNAAAELEYYVAPGGSDAAAGSIDAPFQTLEKARDTIRGLSAVERRQNIRVLLRGGTYKMEKPFVLNVQDGAPLGLTVSYEAFPNETPVLDSGVEITGWKKAAQWPEGAPAAAKGNLYVADMPQGLGRFYSLFDEEGFIARARVPYESAPILPMVIDGTRTRWEELDLLHFKPGPFRQWHNMEDIEIYLKPTRNWVCNYLALKSVDLKENVARTTVEGTYKLSGHPPKRKKSNDIETEMVMGGELCNVPEGLTQPGRWIVDTVKRKIYLWPKSVGQLKQRIVAPALEEYIRIDGKNDEWGNNDVPVRGIAIKGLTLKHGKRFAFRKDSRGVQHDWEQFDEGNAYIRLRGAENCTVSGCSLLNGANSGIRLDLYCRNNKVEGNRIDNLGYTGVLLCGYGPGTKDVNQNNLITNNEISRVGQLWFHALGIFVFQSGFNTISHNYIHDTLYDAIVVSGVRPRFFGYRFKDFPNFPEEYPDLREIMRIMRWKEIGGKPATFKGCLDFAHSRGNVIEYNEIAAAMVEGGDGNALYLSGTFGNTFRYNMVYASPTPPGMFRNDDEQYESEFYGNILIGLDQPRLSGANLKHENAFENNMILNWGQDAIGKVTSLDKENEKNSPGTRVSRNILMHPGGNTSFIGAVDVHYGDGNVFYAAKDPAGSAAWLKQRQAAGQDLNSAAADPMFQDLEHFDFTPKPGSPALARGFQPIPFEAIGLLDKPAVARLRESGITLSQLMAGDRVRAAE